MFDFFRKSKIRKYAEEASVYVLQNYKAPTQSTDMRHSPAEDSAIKYSKKKEPAMPRVPYQHLDTGVRDSDRDTGEPCSGLGTRIQYSPYVEPEPKDRYNASEIPRSLRNYSTAGDFNGVLQTLEQSVNQTFVDRLLYYINKKGVRDSEVYKAARVDKRLFSKIVSSREYKPSKDTAIALALALELSLDEANDMLARAGYTFSHSNKRDIIIEYFFREKVYNLMDANDVLYRLNQKLIGRS